nr:putative reverse transcriptase domain-containing protein [Tanacetum cinerariifolium]
MEYQRNEFAPHPLPPQEGNMNGWLIEDANDSDLESTASNQLMILTMKDTGGSRHVDLEIDGTGGAMALTRWIKKMKSMIDNSGCLANQRVKYAASSFIGNTLIWWNTQVQARGQDAANEMAWNDFKVLLTTDFCPRNEIEKLESEFLNHSMVGADHDGYTDRFHELAKLVPHFITPEAKRVTRYINGLPSQIRRMLRATQPATIQAAILTTRILTDEAVRSGTLTKAGKKRKERDEASKPKSTEKDEKKAKGGQGFAAAVPPRRESGNFPRIFHGCKLELGDSIFTIDLIPLGHRSFDVIVGMDWLSNHKAVIVCHEKIVRIPVEGAKVLYVQGERSVGKTKTLMSIKIDKCTCNFHGLDEPKEGEVGREVLQVQVLVARGTFSWTRGESRWDKVIAYASRQVKIHKKSYVTHDLELGTVVFPLKIWRHFLNGKKSVIYTDHKSLQHIFDQEELNILQRRWLELFSDYKCKIKYHHGKANMVDDALIRKDPRCVWAMAVTIQSGVKGLILAAQGEVFKDENMLAEGLNGTDQQMEKREDGSLYYRDRIWVPLVGGVRTKIMDEAHKMRYYVHPIVDKMYYDL